jgi:hypothetical protein
VEDGLTGVFTEIISPEDLLFDSTGWKTETFGALDVPTFAQSGTTDGYLEIESGTTCSSTVYYGRWFQKNVAGLTLTSAIPYIPSEDGKIYAARIDLQAYAQPESLKAYMPDLRFGSRNQFSTITNQTLFRGQHFNKPDGETDQWNEHIPDIGETMSYYVFWATNDQVPDHDEQLVEGTVDSDFDGRTWKIFFDVLDYDQRGTPGARDAGTWRLVDWVVGSIPRPADLASGDSDRTLLDDVTIDAGVGTFEWDIQGVSSGGTVLQDDPVTDAVTLHVDAGTDAGYALWRKREAVPWQTGKMVRVTPELSIPTTAMRDVFTECRIRLFTVTDVFSHDFLIRREPLLDGNPYVDGHPMMPVAQDGNTSLTTPYEIYLASFGGPSTLIADLEIPGAPDTESTNIAVDLLAIGDTPELEISLHSVLFEVLDEPEVP